jgi:hypothetical protein
MQNPPVAVAAAKHLFLSHWFCIALKKTFQPFSKRKFCPFARLDTSGFPGRFVVRVSRNGRWSFDLRGDERSAGHWIRREEIINERSFANVPTTPDRIHLD